MALKAGCDVNCGNTYLHMMKAYQDGLVTEEEITQAAERLFTTRFLLGLFDETEYDKIGYDKIECPEHLALADRATAEGVVLLKNNGILPLKKERLKAVGVVGPNANSRAALVGNYHGTSSRYITVLEGIQDAVGEDVRVYYSEGCHLFKDRAEGLGKKQDRITEAVSVAENSDVVILCVGLDETLEGEEGDTGNSYASGDKTDLLLPAPQRELLEAVLKVGRPTIVLNMTGSAMDLRVAQEQADAVMQLWYPGARGGRVLEGRSYANAVNIPYMKSLLPEELQRYFELARSMGRLASQFITGRPEEIRFTMVGKRFEEDFGERTFDSPFNYQPFTIAALKTGLPTGP